MGSAEQSISTVERVGAGLIAFLAGGLAGVASVMVYAYDWGLAMLTLTCVGAILLSPAGAVRGAAALGWAVAVLVLARTGPGGDVMLAEDVRGVFLVVDGLVLAGIAAATWPRDQA